MTAPARRPRWAAAVLLPALLLVLALPARAEGEEEDWVARAAGRELSRSNLAYAVVWRVGQDLQEKASGPLTVLRQMVAERVVAQEARRLGLAVTEQEITDRYDRLDTEVRHKTNGAKTLAQIIVREQKTTVQEFRDSLRHQMLKEKVAGHERYLGASLPRDEHERIGQIEVVTTELLKRADLKYGIKTALQDPPTPMQKGWVATVNGEPITVVEFGTELVERLPASRIKGIIEEECKAVLTSAYALSVEQMEGVIASERERWNQWRELTTQEAMRSVSYEDYVKMKYRLDLESLKVDRYFRGLYGLLQSFREQLTPEEVQAEYVAKKDTVYGDRYLVTDLQILFAPQDALLGPSAGRGRRQALQLANVVLRRHHGGVPFDDIAREVNAKRDPTYFARRLRIRNTDNERLLYEQAKLLEDGQVSRPFETLAEVHILMRHEWLPAPTFAEVEDMIRQSIASARAHAWLEERLSDPATVEIRWP